MSGIAKKNKQSLQQTDSNDPKLLQKKEHKILPAISDHNAGLKNLCMLIYTKIESDKSGGKQRIYEKAKPGGGRQIKG